jgi:hypothetical protein
MKLENKVDITVHRQMVGKELTDEQWWVLSAHIENAVFDFIEESFDSWLENLDKIVEEERKYD